MVQYRMSPNIAVRGSDPAQALAFYSGVLGFPARGAEPIDIDADPLTLFLIGDDQVQGPVLELFVDDLEAAREELVANGCEVLRWRGKGEDCYLRDPFGVTFNLWEDPGS